MLQVLLLIQRPTRQPTSMCWKAEWRDNRFVMRQKVLELTINLLQTSIFVPSPKFIHIIQPAPASKELTSSCQSLLRHSLSEGNSVTPSPQLNLQNPRGRDHAFCVGSSHKGLSESKLTGDICGVSRIKVSIIPQGFVSWGIPGLLRNDLTAQSHHD